jgi:ATP-binding cassette subfamily F protein uup
MRERLDPDKSVIYNISGGKEFIEINNKSMHVATYLSNFLFSRERARTPVRTLSGGESNRLLLARLFSQSANLLVLDEPTNDLDVETLELLEELLAQFKGTVLLITHDRQFIDNVVTSMLVWRDGSWEEHMGGYSDYERRSEHLAAEATTESVTVPKARSKNASRAKRSTRSIEQEIIKLSERIDSIERHIEEIHQRMAETEFYELDQDCQAEIVAELRKLETELASTFEAWERLDAEPEQPEQG